jgi:hypothetical protein
MSDMTQQLRRIYLAAGDALRECAAECLAEDWERLLAIAHCFLVQVHGNVALLAEGSCQAVSIGPLLHIHAYEPSN